jgi:hypothetical protein
MIRQHHLQFLDFTHHLMYWSSRQEYFFDGNSGHYLLRAVVTVEAAMIVKEG